MRASSDFFVVGMTGIGTALFLTQLLIVSQQIASADFRLKAAVRAEEIYLPVARWPNAVAPRDIRQLWWKTHCCYSLAPSNILATVMIQPDYPTKALLRKLSGYVDIRFTLMPDGSVASPAVIGEQPAGYGLAASVMKVFPDWKFATDPGQAAVDIAYRIRFTPEQMNPPILPMEPIRDFGFQGPFDKPH